MKNYILDGKIPVPCDNIIEWGRWYEKADRHVGSNLINGARISTVFLGMDHNWNEGGEPILFETMIFGG